MLIFDVYKNGRKADQIKLDGAYMVGGDGLPIKSQISAENGRLSCAKRAAGASALWLLWEVGNGDEVMLSTTRLPERKEPYNLNLELARARIMLIVRKREDWGLIGFTGSEDMDSKFRDLRGYFIEALKMNPIDPAKAAVLADKCLAGCVEFSEQTALFHADIFLARKRKITSGRAIFGCEVYLDDVSEFYLDKLTEVSDFVSVPTPWKQLEPAEGKMDLKTLDAWMQWCSSKNLPVCAGPLMSFEENFLPERTFIWEHDFDTLRDVVNEHIRNIVERYADHVKVWKAISAANAFNSFNLTFEQIMELTRTCCSTIKQLAPSSTVMIDIALPWGEYFAENQRTIPPMTYADMCVQNGVQFDAFGVQVYQGASAPGHFVRDMLQISTRLDDFSSFSKPVHITSLGVPGDNIADSRDNWAGQAPPHKAGAWKKPWSPQAQADWFEFFCRVALSKPFVTTVCWKDLADRKGQYMPHGGLCTEKLAPRLVFERMKKFRRVMKRQPKPKSKK